MKHRFFILLTFFLIILSFTGCANLKEPISISGTHFNTFITITIYDSRDTSLLTQCVDYLEYYDNLFSTTKEESELYQLNNSYIPGVPYNISPELDHVLQKGWEYTLNSGEAFSILLSPLTTLWDFTNPTPVLPDDKAISSALTKISPRDFVTDSGTVTFKQPGMGIDLGAISKGYIADKLKEFLLSKGVRSAVINLGGNVLCIGGKPDGSSFTIGIREPFGEDSRLLGTIRIRDKAVVSSGIYERYFMADNKIYHHLLDTDTGYPIENNIAGVTIISPLSLDGDALSTTCFALGIEDGLSYLESLKDVDGIFADKDGNLYYTDNFVDKYFFKPQK